MAESKTAADMHSRILRSALKVFSEKGYFAATVKDISSEAACNQVTVYRHFEDKKNLFLKTVEKYHEFQFDEEALNARLHYTNLHTDLQIMADALFDTLFSQVDILRIFISDGAAFPEISAWLWFIPEEMVRFIRDYLDSMYMDRMRPQVRDIVAESFAAFVVRTCLRKNVHEGYTEKSRKLSKLVREEMRPNVDITMEMILREINRPDQKH